jgi:hypothetical protein
MRVPVALSAIGFGLAAMMAAASPSHTTDYFSLALRQGMFAPEPLGPPAQFVPPPAFAPLDDKLRLRLNRQTVTAPAQSKGTAATNPDDMIALRQRLDRALNDAGLSYRLFVDDKQVLHGAQPSLVVSGAINPEAIYQINNATNIVKIVREAGFKSLVFYDESGEDGAYVFDLGKAQPCTRSVCL